MGGIATILGKITGNASGSLIKDIGDTVDRFVDTKGEKAERDIKIQELVDKHSEFIVSQANEIEKAYIADTENARNSNVKIQESINASWLAKNVGYLLDLIFTISFLIMLVVIIYKQVPTDNKELFYTGFGALASYVGTILGFHRGSSKSSEDKSKFIHETLSK